MTQKRNWRITVLANRSDDGEVVHRERFHGTADEAVERACKVMGSDPRADIDPM